MKKNTRVMIIVGAVFGLLIALWAVWTFIHRRVIRAFIFNEKMPACPHWLPDCVREMLISHDAPTE